MQLSNRQQIGVFTFLTLGLSWVVEWYIIKGGTILSSTMMLLMFIPALVGIFCSWYFNNGFRDLALHSAIPKYWILAYAVPAAVPLVIFIISLVLGVGEFHVEFGKVLRLLVFMPLLGVLITAVTHSASELGWRGYLQTHVTLSKIPAPYLFVGLIWSAWLWPLVAFSDYTGTKVPLLSVFTFTLTMTAFSIFLGWLRDRSRSVLPVMLAYAVHTTWLREILPGFFKAGDLNPYFGGEAGFLMAIFYIIIAAYIVRREEGFLQV